MGSIADLPPSFTSEPLLQLRTGRTRHIRGTSIKSGIYKSTHIDPVRLTKLGFEGDEHVYEHHGGLEKAVHHYSSRHYTSWRAEIPNSAQHFHPGAFGENLVSHDMHEHNMCIGDVVAVGEEVLLQITYPRQPCYKLNHRFEFKDMSRRVQESGRTGWYYRVLREGQIQAGDQMVLVERHNPRWSIASVQHYLYKDMKNEEAMEELVGLPFLGEGIRNIFRRRLHKAFENQETRLLGPASVGMPEETWSDVRVVKKSRETPTITSFRLEALKPIEGARAIEPGSHIRIRLGDSRLTRAYSIVSGTPNSFELGIALSEASRGGSTYLHQQVREGDVLAVSKIAQSFPVAMEATRHIFIAGGIGITAFIPTALELTRRGLGASYELHFAVRSAKDIPFKQFLAQLGPSITIYDKSASRRLSTNEIFSQQGQEEGVHVYCCGPERLMADVTVAAKLNGWAENRVHFETFSIATSGDPFTVELSSSKKVVEVAGHETLLDVLRDAGLDIPSSCEAGHCGTCVVGVRSGRVEHRGTGLPEEEKGGGMLSCVSRGCGRIVLDM